MTLDAELLRAARVNGGLTQAELAAQARITSRTVGTAERGGLVSAESARCLSAALRLPYLALLRPPAHAVRERLLDRGLLAPPPPVPWAGRREESRRIVRTLRARGRGILLIVCGAPGMGKTALARHAVNELRASFPDGAIWLTASSGSAEDRRALLQHQVAEALGFQDRLPLFGLVDRPAFDQAFRRLLWSRRRLLVLDDVVDDGFVRAYLDDGAPARILVTTAHRHVAEAVGGPQLALGPLPEKAALELLAAHLGWSRLAADRGGAQRLVQLLGGVPRSLQIAGRLLARETLTRIDEYADRIATSAPEPLQDPAPGPWNAPADPDASFVGAYTQLTRRLPKASWDLFSALAVFEDRAFAVSWASAAAGISVAETRAHLGALADAYLVQPDEDRGRRDGQAPEWFHLDAQAHRVARFLAGGGIRKHHLGLLRHARAEALELARLEPADCVARVIASRGSWRQCLDAAVRSVCGGRYPAAARTPEDLPDLSAAEPEELKLVTDILTGLRVYLALTAPPEAGAWLSVGVAAARRSGAPLSLAVLTELLAIWHGLAGHDFARSHVWHLAASEAYELAGRPEDVVRRLSGAAECAWIAHGTHATLPLARRPVELGRRWGVSEHLIAAALNNLAAVMMHGEGGRSRWDEAEALLAEAWRTAGDADDTARVVQSTARLNHATAVRLLGRPAARAADLAPHLRVLSGFVDDALMREHLRAIATSLRIPLASAGLEPRGYEATAEAILTGVPLDRLWQRLIKMSELVLYELGRLGWDPPPAFHPDLVRAVVTPAERVGVTDLVVGIPIGLRLGHGLALLIPLGRGARLLDSAGAEQALRFIDHVSGPEHPLHQLLEGLLLLRAASARA